MFPMVVVPTVVVLTKKFAELALAGTVTELGTVAAGLALDRATSAPLAGAGPVKLTVPVADCPPTTLEGFTPREFNAAGPTAGGLYPSWITSKSLAVKLLNAGFRISLFQRVS